MWRGLIEAYRDRLPVTEATPVVTLHEGDTPLLPAPVLSARVGADVWLKVEGANPTGSFKDRGMTVAVSKAVEAGDKAIICASTGNTSASAAAYAARAGITCAVLVPQGKIALGKLAQALVQRAQQAFDVLRFLVGRDHERDGHRPTVVVARTRSVPAVSGVPAASQQGEPAWVEHRAVQLLDHPVQLRVTGVRAVVRLGPAVRRLRQDQPVVALQLLHET